MLSDKSKSLLETAHKILCAAYNTAESEHAEFSELSKIGFACDAIENLY